jgi:RHS repeat-associated protein
MTCRVEGGITFKQDYNAENRISAIHKMNGTCSTGSVTESWLYGYDGDGVRVTTAHYTGVTLDSLTLYYMGGAYEVTGSQVKKYYSIAGMTVAMNDGSGLKYLLTDHLGSTNVVLDADGDLLSQQRYLPFGEVRTIPNSPILQTDFGYTGQRNLSGTGLMDYRARFYSQSLGRFIQPDSIIPNPTNPQSFNRYSYVINRPLVFTDPSGNTYICDEGCEENLGRKQYTLDDMAEMYGITFGPGSKLMYKVAVLVGVYKVAKALQKEINAARDKDNHSCIDNMSGPDTICSPATEITAVDAFTSNFEPVTFNKVGAFNYQGGSYDWGCKTESATVTCASIDYYYFQSAVLNIVHELGHVFDTGVNVPYIFIRNRNTILRSNNIDYMWQSNTTKSSSETFADLFVAWVYGVWGTNADKVWDGYEEIGSAKHWMTANMSEWVHP